MTRTDTLPAHLAAIIERRMAAPKTAAVIAYVETEDGACERREVFRAASDAEAQAHIRNVVEHKTGRTYVDRSTGRTVCYVSAHVERIA